VLFFTSIKAVGCSINHSLVSVSKLLPLWKVYHLFNMFQISTIEKLYSLQLVCGNHEIKVWQRNEKLLNFVKIWWKRLFSTILEDLRHRLVYSTKHINEVTCCSPSTSHDPMTWIFFGKLSKLFTFKTDFFIYIETILTLFCLLCSTTGLNIKDNVFYPIHFDQESKKCYHEKKTIIFLGHHVWSFFFNSSAVKYLFYPIFVYIFVIMNSALIHN